MGIHWKIRFSGRFTKKQYVGGNCLKREAWIVCRFKAGGAWQKRGGWCFEGALIPQCTLWGLSKSDNKKVIKK